jgi:uncharacterized protein (TIGR02284 family)
MPTDQAVTTLNQLIAIAVDGVAGFRLAADRAEDPRLKTLFSQLATDRQAVVTALQGAVRRFGGEPEDEGTLSGSAHRAFTSLKAAITDTDRTGLLNEVERGESYAVEQFEAALREGELPPEARTVIQTQLAEVRRSRDGVTSMNRIKS